MAKMLCFLLFTSLFQLNQALYVLDSQKILTNNITCTFKDDCWINCVNCNDKRITCQSDYACYINCEQCQNTIITAHSIPETVINCTSCRNAQIDAILPTESSQFELNCKNETISSYPGCPSLEASISHILAVYAKGNILIDNTINIYCIGDGVCYGIYIDSTISGHFNAICDGSQACSFASMIYTPPSNNKGIMDIKCIGNYQGCYRTSIMSLTARRIYLHCGDGTQSAATTDTVCYTVYITGPVLPFNTTIIANSAYSMDTINRDSVVVDCNNNQCHRVEIYVPFGQFQATELNYTYDWDNGLYIRYSGCGWDFPAGGWDFPARNVIQCTDEERIDGIVMWFLREGARVIINNKLITNNCGDAGHCIFYAMDRGTAKNTISCPTDGVSFCYVIAMQENGLSGWTINGGQTRILLLKAYDKMEHDAYYTFSGAIINAPDGDYVPNGILALPAGNGQYAFQNAEIYASNTPKTIVARTHSAFIGAELYVNVSDWISIDCNYHSMCNNLQIYVDHATVNWNITPPDIIPSNLCVICASSYNGCTGMQLIVNQATVNEYTLFTSTDANNIWYWTDANGNKLLPIADSNRDDNNCTRHTEALLNNTWYWWYNPTPSPTIFHDPSLYAPDSCDWVWTELVEMPQPVIDDYCFHDGNNEEGSWTQQCIDNQLVMHHYKYSTECAGKADIYNDSHSDIYADCSHGISCDYATFTFASFDGSDLAGKCQDGFSHVFRQAVFINRCIAMEKDDALYITCTQNTLTLNRYNDSGNCTGTSYESIEYKVGECVAEGDRGTNAQYVQNVECHPYTTPSPTLSISNCLSLTVTVQDADGFNASNFNGLYTYIPSRSQLNNPVWNVPQYPDDKNLAYYHESWVIHGYGDGLLYHESFVSFPPVYDTSAMWKHSTVDGIFHVLIECIVSYSPTSAPTVAPTENTEPTSSPSSAPTRNPTASGDIYDGTIKIVYILTNLTASNIQWLLNYESTDAIQYIKALIENEYFDIKYLPSYQYFSVNILTINGINYLDTNLFTEELLYKYPNLIYVGAEILFRPQYEFYLLTTSQNSAFARNVTNTLRIYFNNTFIRFYVENSDLLTAEIEEEVESPTFVSTFSTLNAFLAICIGISILAYLYNKYSIYQYELLPVDSGNYLAITFYGIQIYDIVSDINLTSEIFTKIDEGAAHIEGEDSEGEIDSFKEYLLIISGWGCLLFIFLPYCMNIYYASKIPRLIKANIVCRRWLSSNISIFITLVAFSGGCYCSLELISSGIFGFYYVNCGLSSFEFTEISEKRILTMVITENVPQFCLQIMYSYSIGSITPNTILAFATSFAVVVSAVLLYCINRDKKGHIHNVDYYLEVKYKDELCLELTEEDRKHIDRHKGMKGNLSEEMVNIYECISIENFEIGYVTLRKDDFVIRFIQHLHSEDLSFKLNQYKYNGEIQDEDGLNEYQQFSYNLYMVNKIEIDNKIFEHYCDLNRDKFDVEYHAYYPGSVTYLDDDANIDGYTLGGTDNTKYGNIKQMIQLSTTKKNEPEIMSSHYEFWYDRRDQFQRGYKLIKAEIEKLKKEKQRDGRKLIIDSMQLHRFIRILNHHNINPIVIEDVINFAIQSNTFKKEERRDSDIDETQIDNDIDQQIEQWAEDNNIEGQPLHTK